MVLANLLFASPHIIHTNYSSLLNRNTKNNKLCLPPRHDGVSSLKTSSPSHRPASPIAVSQTAINMMRLISDKDDEEIKAELDKCQNTWAKPKQCIVDVFSVVVASNPILRCITELLIPKDLESDATHYAATFGTISALIECWNYIFYKQLPDLGIIAIGYAIYKTTFWNYSLLKKGRNPIWTPVIAALHAAKVWFDIMTLSRFKTVTMASLNPISSLILGLWYIMVMWYNYKIQQNK